MKKNFSLIFLFLFLMLMIGCVQPSQERSIQDFQASKSLSSAHIAQQKPNPITQNNGKIYTINGVSSFTITLDGRIKTIYQKIQTLEKETYNPYASVSKGTITFVADGNEEVTPIESYTVDGVKYEKDIESGIWTQTFVGKNKDAGGHRGSLGELEKYFDQNFIQKPPPKGITVSEQTNSYTIHISYEYFRSNPNEKGMITDYYKKQLKDVFNSDPFVTLDLQPDQLEVKNLEVTFEIDKQSLQYKKIIFKNNILIPGKVSPLILKQDFTFSIQGPFIGTIQVPQEALKSSTL